jgi:hypothetical protein
MPNPWKCEVDADHSLSLVPRGKDETVIIATGFGRDVEVRLTRDQAEKASNAMLVLARRG